MSHSNTILILASASPRRYNLLREFGIPFQVVESGVDEEAWEHLPPKPLVETLASFKASAAADRSRLRRGVVLGADTTIDLDGQSLGKPLDAVDAFQMLKRLNGRAHRVLTAVSALDAASGRQETRSLQTEVVFKKLRDDRLKDYAASGESLGKAGAYAIQGSGGDLVERIEGCYNNVVGLPLCVVADLLDTFGVAYPKRPACPEGPTRSHG